MRKETKHKNDEKSGIATQKKKKKKKRKQSEPPQLQGSTP